MMTVQGSICDASSVCSKIILEFSEFNLDYSYLAQVWGIAFSSVLSLWIVSYCLGTIIRAVKNS